MYGWTDYIMFAVASFIGFYVAEFVANKTFKKKHK